MLSGHRQPLVATAAFLLRARAFPLDGKPTLDGAIEAFRGELKIRSSDPDGDVVFDTLFEDDRDAFLADDLEPVGQQREVGSPSFQFRSLKLTDLQLVDLATAANEAGADAVPPREGSLSEDDPILGDVRTALGMGYAGVLLSGPPGTGKSWYAQEVGFALAGTWDTVRSVQFHPSYQYEDFVFGYVAKPEGGFELKEKEFAIVCRAAARDPERTYVLVVDEISRSDVIRVFGEALTYLETDKRDQPFKTASGEELTVPKNLVIIGTMNPWDRGVDELDIALERRFAHIDLPPDPIVLRRLLVNREGAEEAFADRIVGFFRKLQEQDTEGVRVGHAYFLKCTDRQAAERVWAFRLRPSLQRACRLDEALFQRIEQDWNEALASPDGTTTDPNDTNE